MAPHFLPVESQPRPDSEAPELPEPPEPVEISLLAERIADECRGLAATLLSSVGGQLLDELEGRLDRMSHLVRSTRTGTSTLEGEPQTPPRRSRDGKVRINSSPVRSRRNATAPPATLERTSEGSTLTLIAGIQYQGPPRTLQGGHCSVLLDDVMWDAIHAARPGILFTRELTVEYHKPVPLNEPITVTGRLVSNEGRKAFAEGEIRNLANEVCTTARGLWLAPRSP
jgi:acyl-coenzyme A thioesterase PaaI-like protein